MQDLLAHPAVHAAILPLAAALLVAGTLRRGRLPWLAILAGFVTVTALTTGFAFSPLTVSRRILLVVLVAPFVGLAVDAWVRASQDRARRATALLVLAAALLPPWVFATLLAQRAPAAAIATGAAMSAFCALLAWRMLCLRSDGAAAGAAGIGLGIGGGVAALLSASLGFFGQGVAIASASAAVLLVQFARQRLVAPGFTGTLPIGLFAALSAVAATMLAAQPWYVPPLLLAVLGAVQAPRRAATSDRARITVLVLLALAAAALPILAAHFAASAAP
jgi:hypothetical protein